MKGDNTMLSADIRREFFNSTARVKAGNVNRKGAVPASISGRGRISGSLNDSIVHTKDAKVILRKKDK
jgi:hypothetical protein